MYVFSSLPFTAYRGGTKTKIVSRFELWKMAENYYEITKKCQAAQKTIPKKKK